MSSDSDTVFCPLAGKELSTDTCMEICFVTEDEWPEYMLPIAIEITAERRNTCMHCKEHPDIDN